MVLQEKRDAKEHVASKHEKQKQKSTGIKCLIKRHIMSHRMKSIIVNILNADSLQFARRKTAKESIMMRV